MEEQWGVLWAISQDLLQKCTETCFKFIYVDENFSMLPVIMGPFYQYPLNLIPPLISNHTPKKCQMKLRIQSQTSTAAPFQPGSLGCINNFIAFFKLISLLIMSALKLNHVSKSGPTWLLGLPLWTTWKSTCPSGCIPHQWLRSLYSAITTASGPQYYSAVIRFKRSVSANMSHELRNTNMHFKLNDICN